MLNKVLDTIKKYNMLQDGDGIVVGVSGGPDSLTLLHLLILMKEQYNLKLYVAHVNHNLRGEESEGDQRFVEEICNKWAIPLFIESSDINKISKDKKISLEEAGRQVRYDFFEKVRIETESYKIAVGQNKNDNVETILMRIARGTGTEGLSGIKPVRDNVVRPLIEVSRDEIENYCSVNNLEPRIDSSNLEKIYTRNKIRLELIPYIKNEFNPNIIDTINRMGSIVDGDNNFILQCAKDELNEVIIKETKEYIKISREKLCKLHVSIISRIIRILIESYCGNVTNITYVNIDNAIEFINNAKTGSSIDLPKGLKIKRSYNEFIILTNDKNNESLKFSHEIKIPGITKIDEVSANIITDVVSFGEDNKIDKFVQAFDLDKIEGILRVRRRQNGDVINPSGMTGTKKLKDYFIDAKFPRNLRDSIPVVALGEEILWIIGHRVSEKFKPNEYTKNVLVIRYEE